MAYPSSQTGACSVINQTGCDAGNVCVGSDLYAPGVCVPNNIPAFVGGMPLMTLPSCMKDAVLASQNNKQTAEHDAIMGRIGDPINDKLSVCEGKPVVPYCQQPAFYNTKYCACRNSGLPYAECIAVDCTANYTSTAYLDTTQRQVRTGDRSKACPQQQICNSIANIGGGGNIAQVTQTNNCGGTSQKLVANIEANPGLAVLLLVMIVFLASMAASPSGKKRKRPPPGGLDPGFSALAELPQVGQF